VSISVELCGKLAFAVNRQHFDRSGDVPTVPDIPFKGSVSYLDIVGRNSDIRHEAKMTTSGQAKLFGLLNNLLPDLCQT